MPLGAEQADHENTAYNLIPLINNLHLYVLEFVKNPDSTWKFVMSNYAALGSFNISSTGLTGLG